MGGNGSKDAAAAAASTSGNSSNRNNNSSAAPQLHKSSYSNPVPPAPKTRESGGVQLSQEDQERGMTLEEAIKKDVTGGKDMAGGLQFANQMNELKKAVGATDKMEPVRTVPRPGERARHYEILKQTSANKVEPLKLTFGPKTRIPPNLEDTEWKRSNKKYKDDMESYVDFREKLFVFSLGHAAFDYAKRLLADQPENPQIMALFAETTWLYEKVKNSPMRSHWIDRLDILQEGIDTSRKCIELYPEYGPCYRTFTLCSVKAADQNCFFVPFKGYGPMTHYTNIMKVAMRGLSMYPTADVHEHIASLNARCVKSFWSPWRMYGKSCGVPDRPELLEIAEFHHRKAYDLDPTAVENACRLAMVLFDAGKKMESRRWYVRVRDEMPLNSPQDEIWQTVAHTNLSVHFKTRTTNMPLG